jgi:hypothetical protein
MFIAIPPKRWVELCGVASVGFWKEAPPGCAAETRQRSFQVYQVECQSELKIELAKLIIFMRLEAQLYARPRDTSTSE